MPSFLFDLDGTLYTDAGAVPGGPEALAALRAAEVPFRCVTNTTSRSRRALAERLRALRYDIPESGIITPARAAVSRCRTHEWHRVAALVPPAALEDLAGLEVVWSPGEPVPEAAPDAVIVGDLGPEWRFELLQQAFTWLRTGAGLIALSRDRYFQKSGTLTLDAGPFVAALEYAAGVSAIVVGKPSREFYQAALAELAAPPGSPVVMVGDDLWSDIQGAQDAGLGAWLVRTGKFREEALRESGVKPDRVIGSVGEVGWGAVSSEQ